MRRWTGAQTAGLRSSRQAIVFSAEYEGVQLVQPRYLQGVTPHTSAGHATDWQSGSWEERGSCWKSL